MQTVNIPYERYEALVKAEAKIEALERLMNVSNYVTTKEIAEVLEIKRERGGTENGEL